MWSWDLGDFTLESRWFLDHEFVGLVQHGVERKSLRRSSFQCGVRTYMATALLLRFGNSNSSYFSWCGCGLWTRLRPRICCKQACDLKILIRRERRTVGEGLFRTIVCDHTFTHNQIEVRTDIFREGVFRIDLYICKRRFVLYCFTKQEFFSSPSGASRLLHIGLNYWNTCMWEESISFLHSILRRRGLVFVRVVTERTEQYNLRLSDHHYKWVNDIWYIRRFVVCLIVL